MAIEGPLALAVAGLRARAEASWSTAGPFAGAGSGTALGVTAAVFILAFLATSAP